MDGNKVKNLLTGYIQFRTDKRFLLSGGQMLHNHAAELEKLGLSSAEAEIYLALLRNGGPMSATTVAASTGHSRSAVYVALNALINIGLLDAEAGYGGRFSAVSPEHAMRILLARRSDELSQCKQVAADLSEELKSVAGPPKVSDIGENMIQVLRDPRSVADYFQKLQLAAQRQIEVFCKAPYFPGPNKAEQDVLQRGLRARAIYEKEGLEDPLIKPYFRDWVAGGEEARIYDGKLPHKLVIFDSQIVLMPLFTPGEEMRALLIRNAQLAESLGLAFQFIWNQSRPVAPPTKSQTPHVATASCNGHSRRRRKKQLNS
jgi:sugar-specific transcriptional regulator TrmB